MILDIHIEDDIKDWLEEDIPYWDVSYLNQEDKNINGYIIAKADGILAGMQVAKVILNLVNITINSILTDGDVVKKGDKIIEFYGKASNILRIERVMLNILSHMSAIATKTSELQFIAKDKGKRTKIAATRKTLPGLRKYQKWAVIIGGGDTHRLDLSSMVLIKENHVTSLGGIEAAIEKTKSQVSFSHKIEIEVTNEKEAIEAAKAGVDIIMLDNFTPDVISQILPKLREIDNKVLIEASGGINSSTIETYVESDVDIISIGALTHSVTAFDLSLILEN